MLTRRLTKQGFEVDTAVDGIMAIERAGLLPDLILLDMSLPKLSGWDAAGVLKADPKTKKIPLIALTAQAMPGDKERALSAGCDEYETKPVRFALLVEKINQFLAKNEDIF